MARKKKPVNETTEEKQRRMVLEKVAGHATRSEKTSWNRKMDNMVKKLAQIKPIEEQIHELQAKKQPIFDELQELRNTMIKECIHPYEYLTLHNNTVVCKFCEKRMGVVDGGDDS